MCQESGGTKPEAEACKKPAGETGGCKDSECPRHGCDGKARPDGEPFNKLYAAFSSLQYTFNTNTNEEARIQRLLTTCLIILGGTYPLVASSDKDALGGLALGTTLLAAGLVLASAIVANMSLFPKTKDTQSKLLAEWIAKTDLDRYLDFGSQATAHSYENYVWEENHAMARARAIRTRSYLLAQWLFTAGCGAYAVVLVLIIAKRFGLSIG